MSDDLIICTDAAKRHEVFLAEGLEAEREMERTNVYHAAADVFRYLTGRAEGKRVQRPHPRVWRR